jgi:hypothetical protein
MSSRRRRRRSGFRSSERALPRLLSAWERARAAATLLGHSERPCVRPRGHTRSAQPGEDDDEGAVRAVRRCRRERRQMQREEAGGMAAARDARRACTPCRAAGRAWASSHSAQRDVQSAAPSRSVAAGCGVARVAMRSLRGSSSLMSSALLSPSDKRRRGETSMSGCLSGVSRREVGAAERHALELVGVAPAQRSTWAREQSRRWRADFGPARAGAADAAAAACAPAAPASRARAPAPHGALAVRLCALVRLAAARPRGWCCRWR